MNRKMLALTLIVAGAIWSGVAQAQVAPDAPDADTVPDPQQVRGQIDGLVKSFADAKQRATPGMVQQAIAMSISYGAAAWNHGDHAGCAHFYLQTAQNLIAAFPDRNSATPAGRDALDSLQLAVDRAHGYGDDDRTAWTLRYAFDKNQLLCDVTAQKTQGLINLGEEYLKRSQLQESEDALRSAEASLSELDGENPESIPLATRYAPMALANVLFTQEQFDDAAGAVVRGLRYIPDWPSANIDLRQANSTEAAYQMCLAALEHKAQAQPNDAELQFLLGYQYWFTGRHADALDCFHRTLKIDPKHPGALIFLNPDSAKGDLNKPKA